MEPAGGNIVEDTVAQLQELLGAVGEEPSEPPSLQQLKKEASGYGKRRADKQGSRDNLIYRAGYAADAAGALGINPDRFTGILSCSALVGEFLQTVGRNAWAKMSLVEVIKLVLKFPGVGEWAQQEGRHLQWIRLSALNDAETAKFKTTAAYADPAARWRKKAPTREQIYLIDEICRLADEERPVVRTRGEAFDFIDNVGGNPRYWAPPVRLERPSILPSALNEQ